MKKVVKIVNNKDGEMPKWRGFTSYSPNSYAVLVNGNEVGGIMCVSGYPLKNLNPNWGGTGNVWVYADESGEVFADQYLIKVKNWVKSNV